ncbi:Calpain-type cysteine protease DEK1 [Seminavis robusta]|uniref:Calpain-type cysteine protease DEK1 n=1 Tax=Seminavis robusta TaxID=568900 RepID=A0A9N8HX73_9STRA|nr:Calpain-type cysteine protease DEK1 [Seminavis robusta]|eukprot:Sro2402_g326360.1 Calpain-type cysteine protease DEK1 (593) ;mRNA; r:10452-12409
MKLFGKKKKKDKKEKEAEEEPPPEQQEEQQEQTPPSPPPPAEEAEELPPNEDNGGANDEPEPAAAAPPESGEPAAAPAPPPPPVKAEPPIPEGSGDEFLLQDPIPPLVTEKEAAENLDPSCFPRYVLKQYRSSTGTFEFRTRGKEVQKNGKSILKGMKEFKAHPEKWIGMTYQVSMKQWPTKEQEYFLIERKGTQQLAATGIDPKGWMAVLIIEYQHFPPFPNNDFPMELRDKYTDDFSHKGRLLHSGSLKPICPGRGMGCADNPLLKVIGDIDPSDIHQGQVGDCWLLSAISAIAEFDGAVKKLFRKTPNIDEMPRASPNIYTVTLWDLPTWKEVDIVIDERLCANPNTTYSTSTLLSSKPSVDGEMWVCYLEKAIAAHCGGWDAITGGQCVHAWAIMTGCRHQYTFMRNAATNKWQCWARYNPHKKQWLPMENDVHKCDNVTGVWPIPFFTVGDNTETGDTKNEMTDAQVFDKMFACDQVNYIVGAGSKGGGTDEGMVDNHAYTVIEAVKDACGTGIDLFKVRNPWGKGEIEDGEFDDDGPGWDKYPQIKALLNPVVADDGIFWVTKEEFFDFFKTVYISASNMTEFLED